MECYMTVDTKLMSEYFVRYLLPVACCLLPVACMVIPRFDTQDSENKLWRKEETCSDWIARRAMFRLWVKSTNIILFSSREIRLNSIV